MRGGRDYMSEEQRKDLEETVLLLKQLDAKGLSLMNASGKMLAEYQAMVRRSEKKEPSLQNI